MRDNPVITNGQHPAGSSTIKVDRGIDNPSGSAAGPPAAGPVGDIRGTALYRGCTAPRPGAPSPPARAGSTTNPAGEKDGVGPWTEGPTPLSGAVPWRA